jgi:hypothetical protein
MKVYHIFKSGWDGRWGNLYAWTEEVARAQFAAIKQEELEGIEELLVDQKEELADSEFEYSSFYADQIRETEGDIEGLKALNFDNCQDKNARSKISPAIETINWKMIDVVESITPIKESESKLNENPTEAHIA